MRIKKNRTFEGISEVRKSTMGWFYGFKLHIAINDYTLDKNKRN